MKKTCHILHLNTGEKFRGAENQILQFFKATAQYEPKVKNTLACPRKSQLALKLPVKSTVFINPLPILGIYQLHQTIKEHQITHILADTSKAHNIGLILKLLNRNIKLIIIRKSNHPQKKKKSLKYSTSLVDLYIAISNSVKKGLINRGVSPGKIHISKDFIVQDKEKLNFEKVRKIQKESEGKLSISSVANLDQQKNIASLLEALSLYKKKNSYFICRIAGSGPLKEELRERVKKLKLENHVFFLGHIDYVPELLKASDLFILPSINEGLGSSIIEAILNDCFVIGSNHGGIPEMIKHGKTGLLFNPFSPEDISEKIADFHERKVPVEEIKDRALEKIQKEFNPERLIKEMLRLIRQL